MRSTGTRSWVYESSLVPVIVSHAPFVAASGKRDAKGTRTTQLYNRRAEEVTLDEGRSGGTN